MSGVLEALSIGAESLYANRQGLNTTAHNIANAQTKGFSRQRVDLTPRLPSVYNGYTIGRGATVGAVNRSHNRFLEIELNQAASVLGDSETRFDELRKIESIFSPELGASVADEMSAFFDSLQALSNFPDEMSARTAVRERANNLVLAFKNVDTNLRRTRDNLNDSIRSMTSQVNDLVGSIASLNIQIRQMEIGQQAKANDLRDRRDGIVRDLSKLIDITYYDDQHGMIAIRGPNQVLLVEQGHSAALEVARNKENDGMYDVVIADFERAGRRNVTSALGGGSLKAFLDLRDEVSNKLIDQNNEMVTSFVEEFNKAHRQGYGTGKFSESSGRNFFDEVDDPRLAAANLKLDPLISSTTDALAAASTANAPGDNVNLNGLLALKRERLMSDQTATLNDYYANYVGVLGVEVKRVEHLLETNKIMDADLSSRRESGAGVSLDEEAANMIRWQTAFTASSKVITTVDEMIESVLSLKR